MDRLEYSGAELANFTAFTPEQLVLTPSALAELLFADFFFAGGNAATSSVAGQVSVRVSGEATLRYLYEAAPTAVPEPGSLSLLLSGLLLTGAHRLRRALRFDPRQINRR
jgi:hypothetical protein